MSLKLYLITCNLVEEGGHCSFRERLRSLEARQVLDQQWAVRSTYTAGQLKDLLRQFLGDRDRIVVTEVGEERASRRAVALLPRPRPPPVTPPATVASHGSGTSAAAIRASMIGSRPPRPPRVARGPRCPVRR